MTTGRINQVCDHDPSGTGPRFGNGHSDRAADLPQEGLRRPSLAHSARHEDRWRLIIRGGRSGAENRVCDAPPTTIPPRSIYVDRGALFIRE